MRTGIGYALIVVAALCGALGVFFVVAAGGHEPQPIRAAGVMLLAVAGALGLPAMFILRSRR